MAKIVKNAKKSFFYYDIDFNYLSDKTFKSSYLKPKMILIQGEFLVLFFVECYKKKFKIPFERESSGKSLAHKNYVLKF